VSARATGGFEEAVRGGSPILTDGGIETRVMFETDVALPEHVGAAGLVEDPAGGPVLRRIYESYAAAARPSGLPVIIGTPTFRASPNFARQAGLIEDPAGATRRLNASAAAMHREIRERSGPYPVFVAGVIGPSGDAYNPGEALPAGEAREYHAVQAEALAEAGVDFLYAPTFPAVEEALGVSMAMAATGVPRVVSFVLARDGRVLDGTPLRAAIERIDAEAPPLFYSISCVHTSVVERMLRAEAGTPGLAGDRLLELKANASSLSTEELVKLDHLEGDDPERFAAGMWEIHRDFGLRVLGGCCGTDDRHIRALAARFAA
jgi:homocysteine S-methyltransferase